MLCESCMLTSHGGHVIVLYKGYIFSKVYYTQDCKTVWLVELSVTPTSDIRTLPVFVSLMVGNWKVLKWSSL